MVPVRDIGVAVCGAAALLALVGFSSGASAQNDSESVTMHGAPLTLVQSAAAFSPPTLRFQREGGLHAAWIETSGEIYVEWLDGRNTDRRGAGSVSFGTPRE
ncbi:MAG: hypothetical protein WBB60_03045 [Nitrospira sp.]|nr:hypothetical protein [Nitrospira sp.]MBP6604413.1 hypothetical protein [Nitrospira sp.]HQY56391.1 hypothetical protein [Nitrospira sp.]HRA97725.1 hypothetical protein [Nitrospira sp.]